VRETRALTPSSLLNLQPSPRALLSLAPADPATTPRTLTPLPIEACSEDAESSGVGPSAFPAVETGGAGAAAVGFGDPAAPALTLLLVAAPLTTPAAAAGVAAGLAGLLPSERPRLEVTVVAALPGLSAAGGGAAAAPLPPSARVGDPAVAALLHALAGVGVRPSLLGVRGHRPTLDGGGAAGEEEDGGAAAAAALGAAAAGSSGGVARFAGERAARLVPGVAAVRAGSARHGGMTMEPEGGGLMYS